MFLLLCYSILFTISGGGGWIWTLLEYSNCPSRLVDEPCIAVVDHVDDAGAAVIVAVGAGVVVAESLFLFDQRYNMETLKQLFSHFMQL